MWGDCTCSSVHISSFIKLINCSYSACTLMAVPSWHVVLCFHWREEGGGTSQPALISLQWNTHKKYGGRWGQVERPFCISFFTYDVCMNKQITAIDAQTLSLETLMYVHEWEMWSLAGTTVHHGWLGKGEGANQSQMFAVKAYGFW